MSTTVPTFVVAGAARAGTTAVVEALRRHPDVFVTQPKEPHYLALAGRRPQYTGPGDDGTINRVAVTDTAAYRALFSDGAGHPARGEGSVSTLYYHDRAVPRLLETNRDARVVVLLREPVARAYSSHQYLLNRGVEPVPDFLEAVEQEEDRIHAGWHHLWHYTAMSRYADAVAHLRATFGEGSVGVWWYDDLQARPAWCIADIERFIGVDPARAPRTDIQRVNASGTPRRRWVQATMNQAAARPMVRTAVKAVVPFSVRERIRNANLSANDLFPAARAALGRRFRDDLDQLEQVLQRPLPQAWRRP